MSKLILIPQNMNQINENIDYYIFGLENMSTNISQFSLEEIKQAISIGKKVFVSINKNIHNNEIPLLKYNLLELEKLPIEGILFYDLAIPNIKEELNLKIELIWNQEHLTNNYATINYWYNKGIKTAYLSSEITKREILEIKENTSAKLMMNIFGYIPIFTSKRPLIQNYLDTFNINNNQKLFKIKKEQKDYYITSNQTTTVYTNYILNAYNEYIELQDKIDFFVINAFQIEDIDNVINAYNSKSNIQLKFKIETGFLYQETVYKVK